MFFQVLGCIRWCPIAKGILTLMLNGVASKTGHRMRNPVAEFTWRPLLNMVHLKGHKLRVWVVFGLGVIARIFGSRGQRETIQLGVGVGCVALGVARLR